MKIISILFINIFKLIIFWWWDFNFFFWQKRQGQSNSKSRSEKFNPHPEEVASGFPIDPPRPSQVVEVGVDHQVQQHKRASHSGPLNRTAWTKVGKNPDDAPKISNGGDLSAMSGLVAARRSMLSDDRRERSGSSHPEVPKLISRFPGSLKEASESLAQHEQKQTGAPPPKEEGRCSNKEAIPVSSFFFSLMLALSFLLFFCTLYHS